MAGNWSEKPLGDVITLQRGFDLPSQNRKPGKVPIVSSSGISDYHSEVGVKGPGVVTGRYGTIGQVFLIKEDFWPLNTTLWVKDFHGNDPQFISYLLRTLDFQSCCDKSSVPGVNRNDLHRIPVLVPTPAEQKAIAAVLGVLDDLIDLDREINTILEDMARALFKSWFVDFDPVRAKMEGRQPAGMDAETAALFPDELEDSPLGPSPKGWTTGKLGDIGANSRRGVQPGDIAPNTPYIALEHMPRRSISLGDWADSADVASGKSAFKKGEILFGKLRPYFHKVGVAPFDGVCSTDILVLAPKSAEWFGFLLGHASSDELIQFSDLASTGTKMPRTNWSDISSFKVALPPKAIAAAFTSIIQPMLDSIHANLHESSILATLRDTLLPKLLSGDLSTVEVDGLLKGGLYER
jgi:type I restriction enzyme S subunit